MAGVLSLEAARGALCAECLDLESKTVMRPAVTRAEQFQQRIIKVPASAIDGEFAKGPGWVTHPRATRRLMNYWSRGKGAAKIRWFTKGSMRRCIRQLRKYFPENPGGLCANLHHRATGEWPRGGVIPS